MTSAPPDLGAAIDARALSLDLTDIRPLLSRHYAGWPDLVQAGFDPDAFFERWSAELRDGPQRVAFGDFAARIVRFKAAARDRHFKVEGMYGFFASHPQLAIGELEAPAAGVEVASCVPRSNAAGAPTFIEGTLRVAPVYDRARKTGEVLVASGRGPGDRLTLDCGGGEITLNRRAGPAGPRASSPAYDWSSHGDAAIVTIRTLSGGGDADARLRQLAADADAHARHKLIVVDLRGNGGGSDGFVYAWVAKLARGQAERAVAVTGVSGSRCGAWNGLVAGQIWDGIVDTDEARREREVMLGHIRRPGGRPRVSSAIHTFDAKRTYAGRVIVLVDRGSASSAESSAALLASALGATLVGERSGGYFEFGEVVPFILPRTGLALSVPTKRFFPAEPIEEVGLPVDVYLGPEALGAPAEDLLPMLRALPSRGALRGE